MAGNMPSGDLQVQIQRPFPCLSLPVLLDEDVALIKGLGRRQEVVLIE
jgi:hypothetical protein